ncbi:GTP 3',8-cyclase MoaA [Endozoicomonadaceae bacterium StTr2]
MTILKDARGRQFPYLRLSVTDLCNFRCNYCLPDGCKDHNHKKALTVSEIRHLLAAFAALGTRKVRITGGEPCLRKDLPAIIETAATTPGIENVALTTNGYRLQQQLPAWHQAGLNALNISIDSLDPQVFHTITGHNRLNAILRGVDDALALGMKVKVNAVLMRDFNDKALSTFLGWIKDKPVSTRFIELMETGHSKSFFEKHHYSGDHIREELLQRGWSQTPRKKEDGPAQEFTHQDYPGRIGLIQPYSSDFCDDCNRLRVTSIGQLQMCLFADGGFDLRSLLQSEDQHDMLLARIRSLLVHKNDNHFLQQGITGGTQNLAQVGG